MPEASMTSVLDCSSVFHSLWRDEAAIGISDTEKYLAYIDGKKMKLGIKPGDPVKKGSILDGVLSENKTVIRKTMSREDIKKPPYGLTGIQNPESRRS